MQGRFILIVEDNADARDALRMLLELDGHRVETAGEGLEALEIARGKDPDIALIDIGLPGIDGYEVARRIRACGRCSSRSPATVSRRTGSGPRRPASTPCW